MLTRLVGPLTELIRWGEPWDVEDDDPLLDHGSRCDDSFSW